MPFDGTDFFTKKMPETGLFPGWAEYGRNVLLKTRCRRERTAALHALARCDHAAAVAQLLQEAKTLIEDPRKWTQRRYWTFFGRRCAVGALRAAASGMIDPEIAWSAHRLLSQVARSRGFGSIEEMNDRSSHREVLRAFDNAIALAYGTVPQAAS
jgi:hypothetical protein